MEFREFSDIFYFYLVLFAIVNSQFENPQERLNEVSPKTRINIDSLISLINTQTHNGTQSL